MNIAALLASKAVRAVQREVKIRRGDILTATFGMTYTCNLRCVTCGTWVRGETDQETELTTAEILTTGRQLAEVGVQTAILVGSEPLMRRDALDIVEGLRAFGLEVDIITNGTLFTEDRCERLVRAGVKAITVSIDGVGERHNTIRGQPKAFERAMTGIERLEKIRSRLGSDRPTIALHATISLHNTDILEEISALGDEREIEVTFQLASETTESEVQESTLDGQVVAGEEFVSREGSFLPDKEGVRRIRDFLRRPGVLKKHASLNMLASMSDDDILQGRFPVKTCHVLEGEILIDPYGEVRPCSHLEAYSYGNVKRQTVREIWTGIERKRMLTRVRDRMFPVCGKCCQHTMNLTAWQKGRMVLRGFLG